MPRQATIATVAAVVISACALGATAASAQVVTRVYNGKVVGGATVSIEKGVRVYRGLPPASFVVINPGRTPLTLNYNNTTIIGSGDADGVVAAPVPRVGYGWGGWGFGNYGAKRHHRGFMHAGGHHRLGKVIHAPGHKAGGHKGGGHH